VRPRLTATGAAALLLLAGCGGGSDSSHKAATTTPPSHGQTIATPKPSTAPLPPGDAGYLTAEVERSTVESLAAGIARGRAGGAVRAYAAVVLRQRAQITRDDARVAKQLRLKIRPRAISASDRDALRRLVPLTGASFAAAYLSLESRTLPADVSRAEKAAKAASSPKVRSVAAKHLAVYRAEVRARP
jgi:Domain of unknown function (DUF4142)